MTYPHLIGWIDSDDVGQLNRLSHSLATRSGGNSCIWDQLCPQINGPFRYTLIRHQASIAEIVVVVNGIIVEIVVIVVTIIVAIEIKLELDGLQGQYFGIIGRRQSAQ